MVVSTQHDPDVDSETIRDQITAQVIKPVLDGMWSDRIKIHINPTGRFVIGGPHGDAGLTGRKIIVDTYGGMSRHGGGAFSGKDPSKVDRSACYMCRYVAKNVVAAGLADRCEVQVAYAIGVSEPISLYVQTFGTGRIPDADIEGLIRKHFDMTPAGIISQLNLKRPVYQEDLHVRPLRASGVQLGAHRRGAGATGRRRPVASLGRRKTPCPWPHAAPRDPRRIRPPLCSGRPAHTPDSCPERHPCMRPPCPHA